MRKLLPLSTVLLLSLGSAGCLLPPTIEIGPMPPIELHATVHVAADRSAAPIVKESAEPSPVAKAIADAVSPAGRALVDVGWALNAYHEAKGTWPDSLAELRPFLPDPKTHPEVAGLRRFDRIAGGETPPSFQLEYKDSGASVTGSVSVDLSVEAPPPSPKAKSSPPAATHGK